MGQLKFGDQFCAMKMLDFQIVVEVEEEQRLEVERNNVRERIEGDGFIYILLLNNNPVWVASV